MKKYILIFAVFFTVGITGCKKDYLSQEINPNSPSVATPSLLLSGALANAAAIVSGSYPHYGVWTGYWTTSGNYVPNPQINEYQFTNTSFNGVWTALYANLSNFNTLQANASKDKANANFQAIAMIMKAYDFEQLVDNFNNVPYSQAFQPSTILFPAYDKANDIYHDLGVQLDAAIKLINDNPTATSPADADIAFKGNMTKWKKFANTLKLRLAVRVSTIGSTLPNITVNNSDPLITGLAATAGEGYLDGTLAATVNPGYTNTLAFGNSQANPFWATYGTDDTGNDTFGHVYWRASTYAINFYSSNNDPRLQQLYAPTESGGIYQGNLFGVTSAVLGNPKTSAIGAGLLISPTQDAVLFSGAESLFLQSEAALHGLIAGDAKALYEAGITASFTALKLTSAQAATYYGQSAIAYPTAGTTDQKFTAIMTQKWAALNGYFNLEAFNEYRRTGIPDVPPSIDPAAIKPILPKRIFYPLTELTSNPDNLAKQGTIDPFQSTIFWANK